MSDNQVETLEPNVCDIKIENKSESSDSEDEINAEEKFIETQSIEANSTSSPIISPNPIDNATITPVSKDSNGISNILQEESLPDFSTTDLINSAPIHWICDTSSVLTRVITWNMHAKPPPSKELIRKRLIPLNKFHLIVFGSQECEHSIARSAITPSKAKWELYLTEAIGDCYSVISCQTLQAIHMMVFCHKSILRYISDLQVIAVPTGIGNTVGNKGGVASYFKVGDTSCLFICCHLSAHQNNSKQRNSDHIRILNEIEKVITGPVDRSVWFGDLNYRIDGLRTSVEYLSLSCEADEAMMNALLANDQLKREMTDNNVFEGYYEGVIGFKPTYKYNAKSDMYDTSSKRRVPSWTDRILFKQNGISQTSYDTDPQIDSSDHKPVYSTMMLQVSIPSINSHVLSEFVEITSQYQSQVCLIS